MFFDFCSHATLGFGHGVCRQSTSSNNGICAQTPGACWYLFIADTLQHSFFYFFLILYIIAHLPVYFLFFILIISNSFFCFIFYFVYYYAIGHFWSVYISQFFLQRSQEPPIQPLAVAFSPLGNRRSTFAARAQLPPPCPHTLVGGR